MTEFRVGRSNIALSSIVNCVLWIRGYLFRGYLSFLRANGQAIGFKDRGGLYGRRCVLQEPLSGWFR
jgi:hypothetical protein